MNVPKTRKTFCKNCKQHQLFKVTQYKAGKAKLHVQGKVERVIGGIIVNTRKEKI